MKKNNITPKFITFEGCEGSGKSTQSKMLYEKLKNQNIEVIHTREIGGTPLAEKIRTLIMDSDFSEASELFLIMAARQEHVNKVILPALLQGKWVICDRYVNSSAAYQSINSGLTISDILEMHRHIQLDPLLLNENQEYSKFQKADNLMKGILPDITFFLDFPPEEGLKRAIERGDTNKFEQKTMDYHNEVYQNFKNQSETNLYIKSIDCRNKNIDMIHMEIAHLLEGEINANI